MKLKPRSLAVLNNHSFFLVAVWRTLTAVRSFSSIHLLTPMTKVVIHRLAQRLTNCGCATAPYGAYARYSHPSRWQLPADISQLHISIEAKILDISRWGNGIGNANGNANANEIIQFT